MKMNRRKALIGIGSLAVGSGAALGSGAFTSVEATRDVEVAVADDASALLGIAPAGQYAEDSTANDNAVTLSIVGGDTASGVNDDAVSNLGAVLTLANNADSNENTVRLSFASTGSDTVVVEIDGNSATTKVELSIQTTDLSAGGATTDVKATVYTGTEATQDVDTVGSVTIKADAI